MIALPSPRSDRRDCAESQHLGAGVATLLARFPFDSKPRHAAATRKTSAPPSRSTSNAARLERETPTASRASIRERSTISPLKRAPATGRSRTRDALAAEEELSRAASRFRRCGACARRRRSAGQF